jgi:hypothetical protein
MSNIYDKSSLVLIPSGTKTGKVFSQKPVSGDGDFTFTRASAATRVNADGNIEKETQNLLLQSNQFDTTWTNNNSTETSGQSGYDGTNNAWLLNSVGSGSAYVAQSVSSSGVKTLSVYAKAGTADWVIVQMGGGTASYAWFDLSSGAVGTSVQLINSEITSVGGGWYKCSITGANSNTSVNIYISNADNSTSTSSGDNIYIQDAQLEQGLVARDYQETTTAAVYGGITDNTPRLDYTDSSCPALLLEPQRTNELSHSEYIAAGVTWSAASGMTSENNSVVSPEGVQNATKLIRPNSTGAAWVKEGNISATIGLNQVVSVFAKSGSNNILNITYYDQTANDLFFNYDLSNGTIYSAPTSSAYYVDAGIEDYGNGWYRCYAIAEAGRVDPQFQLSVGVNRGGAANSYLYVYGASHEKDVNYPTSYIPTYGSSVSRVVDACNKTGISSLIGQTEGTLFVEVKARRSGRFMLLGSGSNFMELLLNSSGRVNAFVYNGATQADFNSSSTYSTGDTLKIAFAYKANDFVMYVNGVQEGTDTSGAIPSSMSQIRLNSYLISGYEYAQDFKQALLFKTRLSNEELAALTTI